MRSFVSDPSSLGRAIGYGCDHEIVRGLQLIQRPYHGQLDLDRVWSWAYKCSGKTYMNKLSIECYVATFFFTWSSYHTGS